MKLLDVLNKLTSGIVLDKRFHGVVKNYRMDYLLKNSEFFSGGLTGTKPLYFKDVEISHFFEDICGISEEVFIKERATAKDLVLAHKVSSDHFNLLLTYLAHKALRSKLPEADRIALAKEFYLIFLYRTLSALVSSRFSKYQATETQASATYEALSNKFILKKLKSWAAYCDYRANNFLDKTGPQYKRALRPKDGADFVNISVGLQTGVASTFNIIFSIHNEELEKGASSRSSQVEESFGEEVASNSSATDLNTIEALINTIPYPKFINANVITILKYIIPSLKDKSINKLLHGIQEEIRGKNHKAIEKLIRETAVWNLKYMFENRSKYDENDIMSCVRFLRGGWSASHSSDTNHLRLRNKSNEVVSNLLNKKDRQMVNNHRSFLQVYLYLITRFL